jgi:hypothetical protein
MIERLASHPSVGRRVIAYREGRILLIALRRLRDEGVMLYEG